MEPVKNINHLDLNKIYSYADYLLWQFQEKVELIKGKIFKMSPAPSSEHQLAVSALNFAFFQFLRGKPCKVFPAPFDVRLAASPLEPDSKTINVVQPDISVVCDLSKIDEKGCKGTPELIVEVVSKYSVSRDLHEKYDLYETNGVREYWIVHPHDKMLTIFILSDEGKYLPAKPLTIGDIARSVVLAGFELDLNDLFQNMVQEPAEPYGPNVRRI